MGLIIWVCNIDCTYDDGLTVITLCSVLRFDELRCKRLCVGVSVLVVIEGSRI